MKKPRKDPLQKARERAEKILDLRLRSGLPNRYGDAAAATLRRMKIKPRPETREAKDRRQLVRAEVVAQRRGREFFDEEWRPIRPGDEWPDEIERQDFGSGGELWSIVQEIENDPELDREQKDITVQELRGAYYRAMVAESERVADLP